MRAAPLPAALASLLAGCSAGGAPTSSAPVRSLPALAAARTVGPGPRFRPGPAGALVAGARRVAWMGCRAPGRVVAAAHVEIFAAGHVVEIPAGIGFAPPLIRRGAYVTGGRCVYPLRTVEPTGVLLMQAGPALTLGELFALWGQPLSRRAVAGFTAARGTEVRVFLDGVRWPGDPASAPVAHWAQIAIEIGPPVPPHRRYTFPALASLGAGR